MATHSLLKALKNKNPAFGAWLTLPGSIAARTAAHSTPHLSWVCIDCEHGLTPLHTGAAESIQAIAQSLPGGGDPPSALVRIAATGIAGPGGVGWQIKYALDAGARGVIVPMVNTPEQATDVVADSRFPPIGRRGFGSPFTQAAWGIKSGTEYLSVANEAVLVIAQIETKEAVENVEKIAAVDGIDVLFIGPFDLSISLGYPPPSPDPHPDVEKVITRIREAAHSNNKYAAIFCTSGKQAAARAEEGFDMINVTSDSGALTEHISNQLSIAMGKNSN